MAFIPSNVLLADPPGLLDDQLVLNPAVMPARVPCLPTVKVENENPVAHFAAQRDLYIIINSGLLLQ